MSKMPNIRALPPPASLRSAPSPASGRGAENAAAILIKPLSRKREREGPAPQAWEGEGPLPATRFHASNPQIRFLDRLARHQFGGGAADADAASFEQVGAVDDAQHLAHILL